MTIFQVNIACVYGFLHLSHCPKNIQRQEKTKKYRGEHALEAKVETSIA